jgi:hypothetical protein
MSISLKTHKMLWGRAASRCSFPSCRRELVEDATETDDESIVGDIAHIVAEEQNGPRGNSPLTPEQRNKYDNLILLCKIHHKIVDDQPKYHTLNVLQTMKAEHEQWVRESLNIDTEQLRNGEIVADIIQGWVLQADLDNWKGWTSYLFCGDQPQLRKEDDHRLENLREWLLTRIWPEDFKIDIQQALENFRIVLRDFQEVFRERAVLMGSILWTKKFYKISEWDKQRYDKLLQEYGSHVDLVLDLALELTRAANYVCDRVRASFLHSFRREQGILIIESGPFSDLTYRTYRPQYLPTERLDNQPYKGLENFKKKN